MSNKLNWSDLHYDVLQLILEGLDIITYVRARTVCKDWYAVCKRITSVQEKSPWVIIFPDGRSKCGSCLVSDCCTSGLTGKCKFYRLQNLGNDFGTHRCIATCGGWLLMLDLRSSLYVLNVFTRERIKLPPFESHKGRLRVERRRDTNFIINKSSVTTRNAVNKTNAVLWVDERTKRYTVIWSIGLWYMMYARSGFNFSCRMGCRHSVKIIFGFVIGVVGCAKLHSLALLTEMFMTSAGDSSLFSKINLFGAVQRHQQIHKNKCVETPFKI